jgi:SAM-dependent methyltransferase
MGQRFRTRSTQREIMDDLDCSGEVVHQTLRELEFINKWLGGNDVTINALNRLTAQISKEDCLHIVDLGCGSGDMLKLIHQWSVKTGRKVQLTGIDANANILRYAETNLKDHPFIRLVPVDIFSAPFEKMEFDIVIGTLFFHHFSSEDLIQFFSRLRSRVKKGIIINDIHRNPLAYHSIRLLTRIFSKSAMVKYDAPLSVMRAFSKDELSFILKEAGYTHFSIRWKWAFRWQVVINLSSASK